MKIFLLISFYSFTKLILNKKKRRGKHHKKRDLQ